MRESMPSRYEIWNFHRNEDYKNPNGFQMKSGITVPCEYNECWICRYGNDVCYQYPFNTDDPTKDGQKFPVYVDRCHIVAKSIGGSFELSNLVLLCENCHGRMPNTKHPDVFYQWAKKYKKEVNEKRSARFKMMIECAKIYFDDLKSGGLTSHTSDYIEINDSMLRWKRLSELIMSKEILSYIKEQEGVQHYRSVKDNSRYYTEMFGLIRQFEKEKHDIITPATFKEMLDDSYWAAIYCVAVKNDKSK